MGRAASSCLKIMACGSRAATGEDAAPPPAESKSPQDKGKWNFLLRSSKNQVSSNNVTVSGPLASVPEKDEDSEASNKGGSSPQPEQAAGKVRMMKFAEFVPKLSFHLTEHVPFVEDSGSVKDGGATDSTGSTSHRESKSSEQQLPVKDDDAVAEDDSRGTPTGSKASETEAAGDPPACDAATMESGRSAMESVAVEIDAAKDSSNTSLHASQASPPTRQSSVDADRALIRESAALKIQTAIREHLAELALKRNKSVIKLQAAARGYLLRREAVGTLRCVQAILKMQALVRARRPHQNPGNLDNKQPLVREAEGLDCSSKEGSSASWSNTLSLPTEKLLKNGFILQLLESTPRSKRIYISCEPSRSDSAWRWLERWMSVISSDSMLHQEHNLSTTHCAPEELGVLCCSQESSQLCAAIHLPEIPMPCHHPEPNISVEENVNGGNVIECHAATSTRGLTEEADEHLVGNDAPSETYEAVKSDSDELNLGKVETLPFDINTEPAKETREVEGSDKAYQTTVSSEKKEPEVKPSTSELIESKKTEFAVEQVEAEPLNAKDAPSHLPTSPAEIPESEESTSHEIPISYSHSEAESVDKENADSHEPNTHASSESDSETSVSSSPGSPEISESESEQGVCEEGDQESGKHDASEVFTDLGKHGNEKREKHNPSETLLNETLDTADEFAKAELSAKPATLDEQDAHENVGLSHLAYERVKLELTMESTALDELEQHENGDNQQAYSSSSEGSPTHHIVQATTSYDTPPRQIPIGTDNISACDDNANEKQSSSEPTSKRSLSETKHASDLKPDQSVPDSKTAKKRHSIGSNNSLPNYMQATESARAKIHATLSPKGSPDLKDCNPKKRLSLPAGTEKHSSSPRMQRSGSQVHRNPKQNGVHTLNFSERRWQK